MEPPVSRSSTMRSIHILIEDMSACKGCSQLMSFSLHHEYAACHRCAIHLENEQSIKVPDGQIPEDVVPGTTTLMVWFARNYEDPAVRDTLYPNFSGQYVFYTRCENHQESHWKSLEHGFWRYSGRPL
ncbi:hypothetical protein BX666DRAFT_1970996 [Dichotomocladium elegans]|nr:hypothetical protein BX666DRAFT_1970996 [Dichotomocladium elegans]